MKITQYGLSDSAGGWDGVGDSGTDAFKGNEENLILNGVSCALSPSARKKLSCKDGDWLQVTFPSGHTYRRQVADSTSAELLDDRVDFFNAYAFDKQMENFGDFADVVLVEQSNAAQHPWWWPLP